MNRQSLASLLAVGMTAACGGATSTDLFGGSGSGGLNLQGAGGGFYASGSSPGSGGLPSSGGFGGDPFSGGGGGFGNGGFGNGGLGSGGLGSGGVSSGGGSSGGGTSGTGGTSSLVACNFSGTWGTYISQPVSWPAAPFVLDAGKGNIQQWTLTHEVQNGVNVDTELVPCKIFLPDLQGSIAAGFYKYGIRFPDALFDAGGTQVTDFVMHGQVSPSGDVSFTTDPFAILVGLSLDNPVTADWPAASAIQSRDDDKDGKVGVTVIPVSGNGYSLPPTDLLNGLSADLIYIAERTVASIAGKPVSCDEVHGTDTVVPVGTLPGINSSVIGCRNNDGSECSAQQAGFVDGIRPQFTPTGPGTLTSVRLPDNATCADVRNRFPEQP